MEIKPLYLLRHEDVTGTSGLGVVAMGAQYPSGHVVIEWLSVVSSINIYSSVASLEEVHSHNGATEVIFGHPPKKRGRKKNNENK